MSKPMDGAGGAFAPHRGQGWPEGGDKPTQASTGALQPRQALAAVSGNVPAVSVTGTKVGKVATAFLQEHAFDDISNKPLPSLPMVRPQPPPVPHALRIPPPCAADEEVAMLTKGPHFHTKRPTHLDVAGWVSSVTPSPEATPSMLPRSLPSPLPTVDEKLHGEDLPPPLLTPSPGMLSPTTGIAFNGRGFGRTRAGSAPPSRFASPATSPCVSPAPRPFSPRVSQELLPPPPPTASASPKLPSRKRSYSGQDVCSSPLVPPASPRVQDRSPSSPQDSPELSTTVYRLPVCDQVDAFKCISLETAADVILGKYAGVVPNVRFVDCRYGFEYGGGHLPSARNINMAQDLEAEFLHAPDVSDCPPVLVFHCEFSKNRAPRMMRHLRNLDRNMHSHCYPELYYPEVYLLKGGYRAFYEAYPELCEGGYVEMLDPAFRDDCHREHAATKRSFQSKKRRGAVSRSCPSFSRPLTRSLSVPSFSQADDGDARAAFTMGLPPPLSAASFGTAVSEASLPSAPTKRRALNALLDEVDTGGDAPKAPLSAPVMPTDFKGFADTDSDEEL